MIALTLTLLLSTLPTPGPGDASGFGRSLALCGDLDGDRCCEVAVGSPSDGDGHRGKVFIFSGKDGALLRELSGEAHDSGFGTDVATAGDQDGDGIPDLAVGAPLVRGEKGQGRVGVFSGKDGHPIRMLLPEAGERYFGTDVVSIGDVDGDKKEDLVVRMHVGAGSEEHERFAVISGGSGKRLFAVDSPSGVTSHDLGRPLAHLFDVDGDRIPDFAVEYGSDVHIHSGAGGKSLKTLSSPLPADAKSAFGFSICGIPGKAPVVVVGDTREEGHGSVRVFPMYETPAGSGSPYIVGDESLSGVGYSLALAGDLNGDGIPDLAAGWCDGRRGGVLLLSSKDLAEARPVEEESGEGHLPLGWRVAAGLDIDGDKIPDVAVSRYWPTAPATAARGVVIVSGSSGKRIRELITPVPEKSAK